MASLRVVALACLLAALQVRFGSRAVQRRLLEEGTLCRPGGAAAGGTLHPPPDDPLRPLPLMQAVPAAAVVPAGCPANAAAVTETPEQLQQAVDKVTTFRECQGL